MNHKTLLALYGLKYNPFQPELPAEALWPIPGTETFARKLEMLVAHGGFVSHATPSGRVDSIPTVCTATSRCPTIDHAGTDPHHGISCPRQPAGVEPNGCGITLSSG